MKINIEVNNLEELKELCAQLTGGIVVTETTPASEPEPNKKAAPEKKAAKKASTPGGDSTQDTEQSKPGEQPDSIENAEKKEVSATANLHPDVTRKQVTELVKETMKKRRTDVVKVALGRINAAKVTEIPDNLLGVFYTDLEALLGGE
ncbi:hypothetical protein [Enterococcus cecorum]|uniref:hypothetical protein n=1 Tax=Enterococcus cecorum TaxID=44008 RepID=UPI002ACAAEAE|nr:hypothetical protein [Enterococcus cecorum]MDZ5560936.1 hypothetical protein [Enterococcus cecorum]